MFQHGNDGMHMSNYAFGGMHLFWWFFLIVCCFAIVVWFTRYRNRK
ncbi:MAG: hypothetical protein RO257_12050 [Candidatus Kapabacteria bacterium]|nr:hypothetical protein [Candidatus Kapabacteria bacterium]